MIPRLSLRFERSSSRGFIDGNAWAMLFFAIFLVGAVVGLATAIVVPIGISILRGPPRESNDCVSAGGHIVHEPGDKPNVTVWSCVGPDGGAF